MRGILVRLSPDQAQEVRQGAAREAMSLQAFCAQAVLRAARGDGHDLLVEIHAAVCNGRATRPTQEPTASPRLDEAVAALTVLGMQAPEARRRAEKALKALPPNADTAAVVVAATQASAAGLHKEL